jgi:hypothetical protein
MRRLLQLVALLAAVFWLVPAHAIWRVGNLGEDRCFGYPDEGICIPYPMMFSNATQYVRDDGRAYLVLNGGVLETMKAEDFVDAFPEPELQEMGLEAMRAYLVEHNWTDVSKPGSCLLQVTRTPKDTNYAASVVMMWGEGRGFKLTGRSSVNTRAAVREVVERTTLGEEVCRWR